MGLRRRLQEAQEHRGDGAQGEGHHADREPNRGDAALRAQVLGRLGEVGDDVGAAHRRTGCSLAADDGLDDLRHARGPRDHRRAPQLDGEPAHAKGPAGQSADFGAVGLVGRRGGCSGRGRDRSREGDSVGPGLRALGLEEHVVVAVTQERDDRQVVHRVCGLEQELVRGAGHAHAAAVAEDVLGGGEHGHGGDDVVGLDVAAELLADGEGRVQRLRVHLLGPAAAAEGLEEPRARAPHGQLPSAHLAPERLEAAELRLGEVLEEAALRAVSE
mmetsp:Transcript_4116/g.13771  ORF Transcript_4116/g.13771 Transcript_4116/m.13771 type:complete len:273 (-) Transcript_4116:175-993(-)